jgi:putative endonuclease
MFHWLRKLFGITSPTAVGDQGERLAAAWLHRQRGFEVIARNWRSPHDRREEIDLVCRDGDILVFIEVKARAAGALVPGYYAVDRRKKRVLRRAIAAYLRNLPKKPRTFRFDVVEVSAAYIGNAAKGEGKAPPAGSTGPVVLHFENVPLFPKYFRA